MSDHEEVMSAGFRQRLRSELLLTVREHNMRFSRRRRGGLRAALVAPFAVLVVAALSPVVLSGPTAVDVSPGATRDTSTIAFCSTQAHLSEDVDAGALQQITVRGATGEETDQRILDRCAQLWREAGSDVIELQMSGGETVVEQVLTLDLLLCVDRQDHRIAGPFPSCSAVGMHLPR